jgi:hypothetical protein
VMERGGEGQRNHDGDDRWQFLIRAIQNSEGGPAVY